MQKHIFVLFIMQLFFQTTYSNDNKIMNEPDSAYIFAYTSTKNMNRNGLYFAWSTDKTNWHPIGAEHSFLNSDYGPWGAEKRMLDPYLFADDNGLWRCVWSLNEKDGALAFAQSTDLIHWQPQSYPVISENNCLSPTLSYNKSRGSYSITWTSGSDSYCTQTKDFKTYTEAQKNDSSAPNLRAKAIVTGNTETGTIHKIAWSTIDGLIKAQQLSNYKHNLSAENSSTDHSRFASLKSVEVTITPTSAQGKTISNMLIGVFFEDINYAADGGLYGELIQNRDFEYNPIDRAGDKNWNASKAWSLKGDQTTFTIDTLAPIHQNNKNYAVLRIHDRGATLVNDGFDGIAVKGNEKYNFSVFARSPESKKGNLIIRLVGKNGEIYGEATTKSISEDWIKYEAIITAKQSANEAHIEITPQQKGRVDLDMISLFPQKTFKGHPNGLRADLAQVVADMKPRFVRFPGGCVAHGDGLGNMYRWKNTIGALESRKPQRNLWGYHQTAGLGYFEYFQFCEDLGAEPLPVVAAAVPCQNSGHNQCRMAGQQGGIPMCEMDDYVQEILDLIEYANGDAKTTWGKKRVESGHPKPFNLKYIGIGNEDLITDIFEERFTMIHKAVKEKYPEIVVIGTAGPFYEGSDYVEGWKIASKLKVDMIDEHYYNPPGWYIHNQDFYDKYDRTKPKVYLGEYAAHLPGRPNNIETALAEALHLANVERNGDIVAMTSYAPLLAKEGHTQWNPDLIYFNNTEVKPTVGYYVQKLYGENSGDEYLSSQIEYSDKKEAVTKRIASSIVRDNKTGDVIVKLINLLPVEVHTTLNTNSIGPLNSTAVKTVLSGMPSDKEARPVVSIIDNINTNSSHTLPPYSFTVIRLSKNK